MTYEYIRKLTNEISSDVCEVIGKELLAKGIEVYESTEKGSYRNIEMNQAVRNGKEADRKYELFVSAADLEYARNCVTELGLQEVLCPLDETQVVKSAAEAAEEEYYKRRKIRLIECAVVILLGAAYMIYKSLAG